MKASKLVIFSLIVVTISTSSRCKKDVVTSPECNVAIPAIVPFQPYSDPVWHPNGQLLGFNHTPLAGIGRNGNAPCYWYFYSPKSDSTGFYIMNKNGSGFKRITSYRLECPAWSPDGNWLAFNLGPHIYKMRYSVNGFDTSNMIQLTTIGANFFPSWTINSDTLYFDSNVATNGQGYYVWKMASYGSGKIGFPNTGRQPFVAVDNKVYYIGLQAEVYKMDKDGANKTQITTDGNLNGTSSDKTLPKFYNGSIYYQQIGLIRFTGNNSRTTIGGIPCITYDISINGEIVYSKFDYGLNYEKQKGALWIMNADGSNNRQLTFNNF